MTHILDACRCCKIIINDRRVAIYFTSCDEDTLFRGLTVLTDYLIEKAKKQKLSHFKCHFSWDNF